MSILCKHCGFPVISVESIDAVAGRYPDLLVDICQLCRLWRYRNSDGPKEWQDWAYGWCCACNGTIITHPIEANNHACPRRVEAARQGADNTDAGIVRTPTLSERLAYAESLTREDMDD